MARVVRQDWQAVNAAGTVLYTFGDRDAGRAWVRDNACRHDGLILERVEIIAHREYRPRVISRARDFAIPPIPQAA
ncbi:hypothetical protein [Brevundimonas sp.]|uniref:hypothetical protein n=1 Tax=Brevundimonas sp. TaxID=1871086 RepID=UPI002D32F671|nr:hypothetical protein [Brevundimonas sp.]HYC66680.1 hypothetical protein [Brevundimonas sp.]